VHVAADVSTYVQRTLDNSELFRQTYIHVVNDLPCTRVLRISSARSFRNKYVVVFSIIGSYHIIPLGNSNPGRLEVVHESRRGVPKCLPVVLPALTNDTRHAMVNVRAAVMSISNTRPDRSSAETSFTRVLVFRTEAATNRRINFRFVTRES